MIGKQTVQRYNLQTQESPRGRSVSESWEKEEQPAIKSSFIKNELGVTDTGVRGILDGRTGGAYVLEWPFRNDEQRSEEFIRADWLDEIPEPSSDGREQTESDPDDSITEFDENDKTETSNPDEADPNDVLEKMGQDDQKDDESQSSEPNFEEVPEQ
jgi:hypothetical protein